MITFSSQAVVPIVAGLILTVATSVGAEEDYSPYLNNTFPQNVYFGDTHLHSSYSTDAGMVGNTTTPDEAYRVAKGEMITSPTGLKVRLKRPLDFVVLSDHAENLGLAPFIARSDEAVLANPAAKRW
jgi:hypothetical protein